MSETLKISNPSWWRRRSQTERILVVMIAMLLLLILIILGVTFSRNLLTSTQGCKYGSHDICLSPDCIKTAAQVLEKVDLNVNPCEDFYNFACGNFIKNTVIPEDKTSISAFTIVEDEVKELMHNLLKKPIDKKDLKAFVLAKTLYQACINTTEIEQNSIIKFKKIMDKIGGWPVIQGNQWNEDQFNWLSTTYQFMKLGFTYSMLINIYMSANITNSSRNSLFLDQISVKLDTVKRNGFNDTKFQAYYQYMTKVAIVFGAEEKVAQEEMRYVAELIINLARITLRAENRRDSTLENNPMSIKNLTDTFEYVPWLEFINTMLKPYKTVTENTIIIVKVPSYYRELKNILSNTPKRILSNYMFWFLIEENISYLNEELRNLELDFYNTVTGTYTRPTRWIECTQKSIEMDVASGALFVRNYYNNKITNQLTEMISYIKNEFIQTLKKVDWMDEETRKHALEKAEEIYVHKAYPDELLDDQKVDEYYKNLTLNASDYLGCILNLSLFNDNIQYPQLDQKLDKKDWRNHAYAVLVQAFYNTNENSIEFLAGILRNIFFDHKKPKYMNYGSIGHIIGHEITHGFDDEGRQFDKNGNLVNWWKEKTKEAFDAKAQCIIDQYGNITDPTVNLNLNGIKTQGENIADNAGIKLAYLAYKKWSKKFGPEEVLPGLPFTPEQMYWISVANIWCQVQRTKHLALVIEYDFHAPSRYRVNVPFMNSKYFIQDFQCEVETKMNPKHKCQVW